MFNPGDVVQLKSGGPHMTVSKLRIWQGQQEAVCDWFEGTKQHDGSFPVTSLKIVTEDHGGSAEARPSGGGPHSWMR